MALTPPRSGGYFIRHPRKTTIDQEEREGDGAGGVGGKTGGEDFYFWRISSKESEDVGTLYRCSTALKARTGMKIEEKRRWGREKKKYQVETTSRGWRRTSQEIYNIKKLGWRGGKIQRWKSGSRRVAPPKKKYIYINKYICYILMIKKWWGEGISCAFLMALGV